MRAVTDKQIKFIARLVAERDTTSIEESVQDARNAVMRQSFSSADASALIDSLLDLPRKPISAPAEQWEPGVYEDGDSLYRVYIGRNAGVMLAKEIVLHEDGVDYSYAGSARRVLSPSANRLPIEQVGRLGVTAGNCLLCGRDLTDPESIDRGVGPTCAQRY